MPGFHRAGKVAPPWRRPTLLLSCLLALQCVSAQAVDDWQSDRLDFDHRNDFGGVGLLQIPTARFAPDGDMSFSSGRVEPYFRNALMMQPLPWAEFVLRYTTVQNSLYGPQAFSGDQLYKDRGMDLKLRLLEENASHPQVVLGFRDFLGTGLFSSEYLAASRRFYDLDVTVGVAWGNLGSRGQLKNPLTKLFSSFRQRSIDFGQGGNLSSAYFHGERMGLFGGVSYRTPWSGLTLKAEYDSNDYQNEALGNRFKVDSPFNVGVHYRHNDWLEVSLGLERGNTLLAQVSLRGNIHRLGSLPKFDPPPPAVQPRDLRADIVAQAERNAAQQRQQIRERLSQELRAQNFQLETLTLDQGRAVVTVAQNVYRNPAKVVGRTARAMAKILPAEIEALSIIQQERGLDLRMSTVLRKDLENALAYRGSAEEIAAHTRIDPPDTTLFSPHPDDVGQYPQFNWGLNPAMRHHIGGPDDPYIYQIYLRADADLQLTRHLSIGGSLGLDLTNNLDKLKLESDSLLPRVRSDIKNYLKEGKTGITRLQADYLSNLAPHWFGRLSAGLLEEMFAGVGGEVLYRPFGKPWALGMDINRVRQRDFDMMFSLRDYEVTTGHLSLYYQMPFYNTLAQISAGQYLAGDRGVTFDVSRRFDSGAVVGAYFTRTNVSAAQFGEGSFDKGIYFSVPLDLMSMFSSRSSIGMGWSPLTRDGGQRLNLSKRLYPMVNQDGSSQPWAGWSEFLK